MDPQAITLILGGLGTAIGAAFAGIALYKEKSAPHSAILGTLKLLWNFLDFTRVDEALIAQLRAGGTIAAIIPARVRRAVLRIIDPDALKGDNRSERKRKAEEVAEDDDEF